VPLGTSRSTNWSTRRRLPTANNVHQVAQAAEPSSRIVYVDNDHCKSGCAHARQAVEVACFVSCSIHVRDDGPHAVNYAQRHDQDAIAAMMASPLIRRHVEQVRLIAAVHPEHYTVRLVCRAA